MLRAAGYVFSRGATRAPYSNHSGKATLPFACLWPESSPVSKSEYLGEDTRSSACVATMEMKWKFLQVRCALGNYFLGQSVMSLVTRQTVVKNYDVNLSILSTQKVFTVCYFLFQILVKESTVWPSTCIWKSDTVLQCSPRKQLHGVWTHCYYMLAFCYYMWLVMEQTADQDFDTIISWNQMRMTILCVRLPSGEWPRGQHGKIVLTPVHTCKWFACLTY